MFVCARCLSLWVWHASGRAVRALEHDATNTRGLAIADPKLSQIPGSGTFFAMPHCRTGGPRGARCQMYHTTSRPGIMKPQAAGTARELRACKRPHTHCRSKFHRLAQRRSIPHLSITCPLLEIVKAGVKSFPKCLFLLLDVGRLANAALAQGAAGLLLLLQLYNREPSTVRAAARRHGRLYALRYLFGDALWRAGVCGVGDAPAWAYPAAEAPRTCWAA